MMVQENPSMDMKPKFRYIMVSIVAIGFHTSTDLKHLLLPQARQLISITVVGRLLFQLDLSVFGALVSGTVENLLDARHDGGSLSGAQSNGGWFNRDGERRGKLRSDGQSLLLRALRFQPTAPTARSRTVETPRFPLTILFGG